MKRAHEEHQDNVNKMVWMMGKMKISEDQHAMSFAQPQGWPEEEKKMEGEEKELSNDGDEWEPLYEENLEKEERARPGVKDPAHRLPARHAKAKAE